VTNGGSVSGQAKSDFGVPTPEKTSAVRPEPVEEYVSKPYAVILPKKVKVPALGKMHARLRKADRAGLEFETSLPKSFLDVVALVEAERL
jgi:hypothetical protein